MINMHLISDQDQYTSIYALRIPSHAVEPLFVLRTRDLNSSSSEPHSRLFVVDTIDEFVFNRSLMTVPSPSPVYQ